MTRWSCARQALYSPKLHLVTGACKAVTVPGPGREVRVLIRWLAAMVMTMIEIL